MWSTGAADVMKRIAAPMIGGIFTSFTLELIVYPEMVARDEGSIRHLYANHGNYIWNNRCGDTAVMRNGVCRA